MAALLTDFQFDFEPAYPVIEDNNEFDEFAQEMAGTHKNYNNDVYTMIRVLGEECRIFPPAPDTELGLLTNTLGYMQEGYPHTYAFGADEDEEDYEEDDEDYEEDEEEDPDNRYEVEVPCMNNMENSSPPEELPNNEEYDEYEDENLNPDMFEDEDEDDEDYSSDEDE